MNTKRVALYVLFFSFLCGCSDKQVEWVKPISTPLVCGDYKSVKLEQGLLNNNVWNKQAAEGQPYSQCLESRELNGKTQYGWSWSWPNTQRAVFGQPQIKIGQSPWQLDQRFGNDLPMSITKLKSLVVNSSLSVETNGEHNVAITLWLVGQDAYKEGRAVEKESIRLELMIWTYYTDKQFDPAGRMQGVFSDGDVQWEYWQKEKWRDLSKQNDNEWQHIAFRRKYPSLDTSVDVKALVNNAIERGHVDKNWIIADLELGTEVMAGEGIAWLEKFDVEIEELATTSE